MTRAAKRLFWIAGAALVLLVGLGAYAYFFATNAALVRAEGFQFRRMQVPRIPGSEAYRFFFVTNRQSGDTGAGPEGRFGPERAGQLTLGYFDTEIEPSLGLGRWLDAGSWLLEHEIRIVRLGELDRAQFFAQVRAMVDASPQRALLVLVHGYRTNFDLALRGTAFLAHILDADAPVLVFDWPGNQGDSLGGYRRARRVASESGADLAETLRLIRKEIAPDRLWLVANSLGGQVVVDAVSALHRDPTLWSQGPPLDQVVLTAPDVDREGFHSGLRDELADLARRTTVYVSSNDRALLVSQAINRSSRLGQSTLDKSRAEPVGDTDPSDESEEAAALLDLMAPGDERLSLVDVTPVNRTRNFHNFSLEVPEYFDDVFLRLTNQETPQNRLRYRLRTPDGKVYWVLTRGR